MKITGVPISTDEFDCYKIIHAVLRENKLEMICTLREMTKGHQNINVSDILDLLLMLILLLLLLLLSSLLFMIIVNMNIIVITIIIILFERRYTVVIYLFILTLYLFADIFF